MRTRTVVTIGLGLAVAASAAAGEPASERYRPRKDPDRLRRQPYERYFTIDRFGREITFYLSETPPDAGRLPLIAYVHGSGCTSHFVRDGDRTIPKNGHIDLAEGTRGIARVLIVEKPGVRFLDDPRDPASRSGSPEFRREHTLERWAEAVEAAIRAARTLPGIRSDRTLVVGHSEGGLVACRVARDLPVIVTHVASLAGGGPTQLFDLVTLARKGSFFAEVSSDPEARVRHVLDQWGAIRSDPESTEKLFLGFAYRRWSSFLASSPIEELGGVSARIFVGQGTEDDAVDPASADALCAHLRAKGKSVEYDRVAGADHSFQVKGAPESNGWKGEMGRVVEWFLK